MLIILYILGSMSQYKGVLATITSASSNLPDHDNSGSKKCPDNFSARSPEKELPLKKIEKSPTSSKPIEIEDEEVSWPSPHSKVAESTLGQISNSMEIIGYNPWEVSDASRFLKFGYSEKATKFEKIFHLQSDFISYRY